MSPLNTGPPSGPRVPRPLMPRFGSRHPGLPPRMIPPGPITPLMRPMRPRLPVLHRPRTLPPPLMFNPRGRGMPPPGLPSGLRNPMLRPPFMGPWLGLPPCLSMRPRFPMHNGNVKGRGIIELEELEMKKPWMNDEIRSEIQKKNKLYAKAKKNKDVKDWEEFKNVKNKVTKMIRDAKTEYLAKNPDQAHLYQIEEEPYDQRDENNSGTEEDTNFYCEVCDKHFPTADYLTKHKETHKLCGIDGCTFLAHPMLVEKHIRMQHTTGLYDKIKNVTTPEDIEKWIAERKKRYPTKVNIEMKKTQELRKLQRGEIIKEKNSSRLDKQKLPRSNKRRKRVKPRNSSTPVSNVITTETYRGLIPFPGMQDEKEIIPEQITTVEDNVEIEETNIDISDDEDLPCTKNSTSTTNMLSLVADYNSDTEDDTPTEEPILKIKDPIREENPKPMEISNQKSDKVPNKFLSKKNQRNLKTKYQSHNHSKQLKFLKKLLSRSIQHERNVICQGIKFIMDKNFFDSQ